MATADRISRARCLSSGRLRIDLLRQDPENSEPEMGSCELRRLFDEAIRERADAAVVSSGGFFLAHRQLIVELAAASRLPAMYAFCDFIEAGGVGGLPPPLRGGGGGPGPPRR